MEIVALLVFLAVIASAILAPSPSTVHPEPTPSLKLKERGAVPST